MKKLSIIPKRLETKHRKAFRDLGYGFVVLDLGIIKGERDMKKLSSKKKIRQIQMLNKNLQKIKLRKSKRVKDEKKAAERERALPRNR
jgi:hypothetical protein|tara:strand:+ start:302 stop:565 length:264 start_codon:yes stop_codon:yes gene_type:complete